MRFFFAVFIMMLQLHAGPIDGYATVGIVSHHFGSDENGNAFNENHHAYGAEIDYDRRYLLAYIHFTNSRDKETDIIAAGYRYDLYGPFGIAGVVGYQSGYCFDGLKSVECTAGKTDSGLAFTPMLYYRHDYFTLDLISEGKMVALKLNLKLF